MGFLFSLLAGLPGLIGQYFAAKTQITLANINAQVQMASDATALSSIQLQATSQKFKEWMIVLLFTPMLLRILFHVDVFSALSGMPEWYLQECVAIYNTVFGITVATSTISKIIDKISLFASIKHSAQVEIARINQK
jgi:hypothetical protein